LQISAVLPTSASTTIFDDDMDVGTFLHCVQHPLDRRSIEEIGTIKHAAPNRVRWHFNCQALCDPNCRNRRTDSIEPVCAETAGPGCPPSVLAEAAARSLLLTHVDQYLTYNTTVRQYRSRRNRRSGRCKKGRSPHDGGENGAMHGVVCTYYGPTLLLKKPLRQMTVRTCRTGTRQSAVPAWPR